MAEFQEVAAVNNQLNTKEFNNSIQIMRWLLQVLGVWPLKSSSYPNILRWFLIATGSFLLIFLLIPCCLYMFLIVTDIQIRLRLIGPLSFCLMNILKYLSLLLKNNEIRECIFWMASDWQKSNNITERNLMLESAKSARFFIKICVVFMYGSGMPYSSILVFVQDPIIVGNLSIKQLAYPSHYIFFNPYIRPMHDVIYVIHCFCGFTMYTITCAACSIAIACIMHTCGQIAVTSRMLQNLTVSFDNDTFKKIIKNHLRLLEFVSKLEHILSSVCFIEIVGSTFNICMLGYYFMTEYKDNAFGAYVYIFLWISFIFNIFSFCYVGDLLTEQCNSIGNIAYMIDWYHLSAKDARNLVLIVASTKHPVSLTAGKIITLSLQTFTNVLKASFTYMNLLRTLTADVREQ